MTSRSKSAPTEIVSHGLKTWPGPFEAVWHGRKTYEIRKDDRGFAVGDKLVLREWDPETKHYSGCWIETEVTHVTRGGEWGIPEGMCVMSIRTIRRWSAGAEQRD